MKLKIGKTSYRVYSAPYLGHPLLRGKISYVDKTIRVATERYGKQRSDIEQHTTLWHEVVHGILYDIGSKQYRDEVFVDRIARRIVAVNQQLQEYHANN